MKWNIIGLILIFAGNATLAQNLIQVEVEHGKLKGLQKRGMSVFKGIPLAAPHIKGLRWKTPQATSSWEGINGDYEFASSTYQLRALFSYLWKSGEGSLNSKHTLRLSSL